jgi:aryl-alcohol dehydrogenase
VEIQAAVTDAKGAGFAIQPLEMDEPRAGEVLVRIAASGICHTDLICRDQWYPVPLPAVLGHEGAGIVEAIGPGVSKVAVGDHVAMSFNSCADCPTCRAGRPGYCHDFFAHNFGASRPDGSTALSRNGEAIHSHFFGQSSFATHSMATERNIVKLDPDIPLEVVAPLGCGIQTGAGAILNVMRPPAGASIAVFGTGTVGLAAVMAARATGATTIVGVDINEARLQLARELGATHTVNATEEDVVEAVKEATGMGADFAIESTGVPEVLRQAVDSSAPTGVTGVIGAPAMGTEVSLDVNAILVLGRTVRGIVEGDAVPENFIPGLIELWQQGRFPMDRLMRTYDFDQIEEAADHSGDGHVVKAVLRM